MRNIITILALIFGMQLQAGDWAWGENEVVARGNWLQMEKLVKQKKYMEATPPLVWLLTNTPNLNDALYINAIKVYSSRAEKEKNEAKRIALEDSTLMLYSKRIELFGKEASNLNRKGKDAYKYLYKRKGKDAELFELYTKIYALNKNNTYPENMYYYMATACAQHKAGSLDKAQMFELYNNCEAVFNSAIASGKKVDRTERYQGLCAQLFNQNVEVTCEEISAQFGEKFESSKDEKSAKLIISISVAQKCYNTSSFISAAEYLSSVNKSNAALEKILASVYLKNDSTDKALAAFGRCKNLTTDSAKLADLHIDIASVYATAGKKSMAKQNALKALDFNPTLKKAYLMIGDLYFQSGNQCASDNKVQARSIYIAAYNMYIKGGDMNKASECKSQFPSMEEMFLYNLKPGDTMNTGCWINEQIILQKR